ncbi:fibronectin type III domain-containing protein [Pseudomonas fluorescens]
MKGYEVYLNDQFLSFVTYQYNNDPYTYLPELSREEKHVIKVRAVDINDLFSEYGTFVIPVIPNLINRKIFITGYDEENEIYNACSKWEPDSEPTVGLLYHFKIDGGFIYRYFFHPGEEIIFNFQARQGQTIQTQIWTIYSEYHLKGPEDIFIFDASRPEPISNLKFTNTAQAGTSISWTPSTSTNVINYAISINEESPILIPSSVNAYTFEPLSPGKEFLIEIWALNDVDVPSALEEITIEPIDFTPPASPERPFSVPSPPPRQLPPGPPRPTMLP